MLAKVWNGSSWVLVAPKVMMDSVTRYAVSEIGKLGPWMTATGARVVVGECAWNDASFYTYDLASWQTVGEQWMRTCSSMGVGWQYCDVYKNPTGGGVYHAASANGDLSVVNTPATVCERHFANDQRNGVLFHNLGGADGNGGGTIAATLVSNGLKFSNLNPGTAGVDYYWPTAADFTFLASRGVRLVNIPIRWERLQPTLGAALSSSHLSALQSVIAAATAAGLKVCIRGAYGAGSFLDLGNPGGVTTYQLTRSGVVSWAYFADYWSRVATALSGNVFAFDLLNEPKLPYCGTPTGPELCPTGVFNSSGDVSGWFTGSPTYSTAQAYSSSGSMLLTSSGNPTLATGPSFSVTPGVAYLYSCYSRQVGSYGTVYSAAALRWYDAGGTWIGTDNNANPLATDQQWMEHTGAAVAPAGAVTARPCFWMRLANGQQVYVDNFSVKACVSGSYVTRDQNWQGASQAAVDAIRAVDATTEIWVSAPNGANLNSLVSGPAWITDPQNKTLYNVHHYWDGVEGYPGLYHNPYHAERDFQDAAGYA